MKLNLGWITQGNGLYRCRIRRIFLYLHMSEKQGIDASVLNRQHIYDYASSEFNGCFFKVLLVFPINIYFYDKNFTFDRQN